MGWNCVPSLYTQDQTARFIWVHEMKLCIFADYAKPPYIKISGRIQDLIQPYFKRLIRIWDEFVWQDQLRPKISGKCILKRQDSPLYIFWLMVRFLGTVLMSFHEDMWSFFLESLNISWLPVTFYGFSIKNLIKCGQFIIEGIHCFKIISTK